jgi:CheY-like chemotaxis protein
MNDIRLPSNGPLKSSHNPALDAGSDVKFDPPLPRILVVDDEALIADTIVQILNRSGFIAVAAYGGKEAVETARSTIPEIVLSDVLMPHFDGVEAAIAIQKFLPETRIVLFSGQAATVEILARARQRGYHFELLAKPVHPVQLIKHLRQK